MGGSVLFGDRSDKVFSLREVALNMVDLFICGDEWRKYASDEQYRILGFRADGEDAGLPFFDAERPFQFQRVGGSVFFACVYNGSG